MSTLTHSIPALVENDVLVVEMRQPEARAWLAVKAWTTGTAFTIESYRSLDATENPPASSTSFTMVALERRRIDIPESGDAHHQLIRLVMTEGRISLEVTSPTVCRYYIEQPENPPRIA